MNKSKPSYGGFSLVEVVVALGIVSFCLVVLISLMPVSLKSVRDARKYAAASSAIQKIGVAIREAPGAANQYMAIGNYSNLVWNVGASSSVNFTWTNISLSGDPVTGSAPAVVAHVNLVPPTSLVSPGPAQISVAWPPSAVWNTASDNWNNAQGSVSEWMIFVPKQ